MSKDQKKSFVAGAAILSVAGILCKLIGAIYRIPLQNNILGVSGTPFYQLAYPIYTYLLVISSAGLPTAISRMVSERITNDNEAGAYEVFKLSLKILTIIGLVTTIFMAAFSKTISITISKNAHAVWSFVALAPALLLVSIMSAYRGYFQGKQNMVPTAISQVIEQLGKVVFGFPLAIYFMKYGPQYGAAGALLGVSISELFSMLYMIIVYKKNLPEIKSAIAQNRLRRPESIRKIGKQLLQIALPITLGASVMPLVLIIDDVLIINRLTAIGYDVVHARELMGLLTGNVATLVNMPQVLTLALAMSLVPVISSLRVTDDILGRNATITQGIKLAWIVGLPCFAGLYILAEPILKLLYSRYDIEHIKIAAACMKNMSLAILFLSLLQTSTGILQGLGKQNVPVITLLIGATIKALATYILVGIPSINIIGAPYGTIACYGVAMLLNLYAIFKETKMNINVFDVALRPIIATLGMAIATWGVMSLTGGAEMGKVMTLVAVMVGGATYLLMLLVTGTITKSDLDTMPGGKKISKIMMRIGLMR